MKCHFIFLCFFAVLQGNCPVKGEPFLMKNGKKPNGFGNMHTDVPYLTYPPYLSDTLPLGKTPVAPYGVIAAFYNSP
jgi:hypothetical protein